MIILESIDHGINFEYPSADFQVTGRDMLKLLELLGVPGDRSRINTVLHVTISFEGLTDDDLSDYRFTREGDRVHSNLEFDLGLSNQLPSGED